MIYCYCDYSLKGLVFPNLIILTLTVDLFKKVTDISTDQSERGIPQLLLSLFGSLSAFQGFFINSKAETLKFSCQRHTDSGTSAWYISIYLLMYSTLNVRQSHLNDPYGIGDVKIAYCSISYSFYVIMFLSFKFLKELNQLKHTCPARQSCPPSL